jgi:hypothetical protein
MALGMLGRMEEQAQHVAGELAPANCPWREKIRLRCLPQAAQRGFDGCIDCFEQLVGRGRWSPRVAFLPQDGELRGSERSPVGRK